MEIESHLFPIPDSIYSSNGFLDPYFPLSLIALNLTIVSSPDNMMSDQRKKGFFFFRNSGVPKPRPCTILAWERICRLGNLKSKTFMIPFLPSMREEDEVGTAIGTRGERLPSLSRKSALHVKDKLGRIHWGNVYIATLRTDSSNVLIASLDRSNATESLVVPYHDQHYKSSQDSIRARMEFLASHGILGFDSGNPDFILPVARRLLFQFTAQQAADEWAQEYRRCHHLVDSDPAQVNADWKVLCEELILKKRGAESADPPTGKILRGKDRFGSIAEIEF